MGKRKQAKVLAAWRQTAYGQARDWALRIWHGRYDAPPPYEQGIVLWEGERVLGRVPVCMSQLVTTTHQERRQKMFLGIIEPIDHRCIVQDVTSQRWIGGSAHDFVVTNMRAVYRDQTGFDGVAWHLVTGIDIDLEHDQVRIDGNTEDGTPFTITFTGPTVAPIAVAAVGHCFGPEAMATHPRLAALRTHGAPPLRSAAPPELGRSNPRELSTEVQHASDAGLMS